MGKRVTLLLVATIMLVSQLFVPTYEARSIDDVEKKIKEIEQKQKDLQKNEKSIKQEKSKTSELIKENKQKQSSIQLELSELEESIQATEQKISAKENEISSLQNEITSLENKVTEIEDEIDQLNDQIDQLNHEIKEVTKRIERRENILRERLRSMQITGGSVSYLEVLFGAQSFADLISRITAVNTIMKQDKVLIEDHKSDKLTLENNKQEMNEKQVKLMDNKKELVAKKEEIEENKAQVESERSSLVALKNDLANKSKQKERLFAELKREGENLREYEISLEEERKVLAARAAALEKAKKLEQQEKERLVQLAKQKEQEEEEEGNTNPEPSGNRIFVRPAEGRFTSQYGMRFHPIHNKWKMHSGIDIANSTGTRINAAASGVVSDARWIGGYGRCVIIVHTINGEVYTTLYAHLNSITVSVGQVVQAGQQIGYMGTTGDSTGPHLHFEVHKNGFNFDGSYAVNPQSFLINPY